MSRTVLASGGGLLLLAVSGCAVPFSGPDPGEALDRLAAGLTAGDLEGVPIAGDRAAAEAAYTQVTEGLQRLGAPRVRAGEVSEDDGTATGELRWTRTVGEEEWSYATSVRLTERDVEGEATWLVEWTPTLVEPSLQDGEVLAASTIKAERGDVLGAGDRPLVTPRPVLRVGVDKSQAPAAALDDSAAAVARLVDVDVAAFTKQVQGAGPRAFVQAIVYRRDEAPQALLGRLGDVPGGRAISDRLPLAPSRDFASAILGTVGPATKEIVDDSEGRVQAGDEVGLSGLQRRYDARLAGTRGATVVAVDAEGERRTLFTADPVAGEDLRTTLDEGLQTRAQRVLADVGPASALVAVRPSTGELVAAASGPGSNGYNTATFGQYAPGSTFKVVSTLALLRAGLDPDARVDCPATTVVDGKRFKNYDDYPASGLGRITLTDALANSCNTAFIGQREQITGDALAQAAAALGLGVDHDLGFPAYFGQVEPAASQTQGAASLIGQGTVLASPMAMAAVTASVVQGAAVVPRLLPDVEVEPVAPAAPLTAAEARQLRTMMRAVVERGSGSVLQGLGADVIAKTGTAEFGEEPPLPTHAWMVAARGDLAVAVFVERGDSGSGTAGPLLRSFLAGG